MEFEGKVWKDPDSLWWIAEIAFLDVMTQGETKTNALEMVKDAVMELLKDSYKLDAKFSLTVNAYEGGIIKLRASDYKLLIDFGSKRKQMRSNAYPSGRGDVTD